MNLRQHRRTGQPGFPSAGWPRVWGARAGVGLTASRSAASQMGSEDTAGGRACFPVPRHLGTRVAGVGVHTRTARTGSVATRSLRRGGVCGGVFSPPLPERPPGGSAVDRHSRFPIRKSSACTRRPCATSQIEQMLIFFFPDLLWVFLEEIKVGVEVLPQPQPSLSDRFSACGTLGSQRPGWQPRGERPPVTSRKDLGPSTTTRSAWKGTLLPQLEPPTTPDLTHTRRQEPETLGQLPGSHTRS